MLIPFTKYLFFCRTPLQSLIVNRLIQTITIPFHPVVIYSPTSSMEKHKVYFDKINVDEKLFIDWKPVKYSEVLMELSVWFRVPNHIRKYSFSKLYIGDVRNIAFGLFVGKNPDGELYTFDDGSVTLNERVFKRWIYQETKIRKFIRYLFNGIQIPSILKRANIHYTIYPQELIKCISYKIENLDIFPNSGPTSPNKRSKKTRILLGSWFPKPNSQMLHNDILKSSLFDLVLAHPATNDAQRIPYDMNDWGIEQMIAEEVVFKLLSEGYKPVLYGFNSSTLYNMTHFVPTITIQIDPDWNNIDEKVLKIFKIKRIDGHRIKLLG